MDEIRREAMNDYKQRTKEQKQHAWDFFKAMDSDGNGSISIHEFVEFLRQNGLFNDNFYELFAELDKDHNGTLDHEELITLFFIFNHRKYRDLFAATSSNVNTHQGLGLKVVEYVAEAELILAHGAEELERCAARRIPMGVKNPYIETVEARALRVMPGPSLYIRFWAGYEKLGREVKLMGKPGKLRSSFVVVIIVVVVSTIQHSLQKTNNA